MSQSVVFIFIFSTDDNNLVYNSRFLESIPFAEQPRITIIYLL